MKLAFSTNAYLKFSFSEAVRRLAAIGYAGVEIMADVPHAWPAFLLEEQKQGIREVLWCSARTTVISPTSEPRKRLHLGCLFSQKNSPICADARRCIEDVKRNYCH